MELTRVELNPGDARARRDLANPYEMHSTLARAFADGAQYPARNFLWRLEPRIGLANPVLLVQSQSAAHWGNFEKVQSNWALAIDSKQVDERTLVTSGRILRFRLRANPTVTRQGKRHGLYREDDQIGWLERQAARHGFEAQALAVSEPSRIVASRRRSGASQVVVYSALFDGVLRVTDVDLFVHALREGLGHAKALGLGLLSVAGGSAS